MGLDITAYNNIDVVRYAPEYIESFEDMAGIDYGFVNPDFPHAVTAEIDEGTQYIYFMEHGGTEYISFHAGSYSGYNLFRSSLCDGFKDRDAWEDYDSYRDEPFFEIICFSDCEGSFFGNEVCNNLLDDFLTHREDYVRRAGDNDWLIHAYDNFTEAFRLGSENGIVIFR